jgi:hypothetical protein
MRPFRLTNAPAFFQDMIIHILKVFLDKAIVVYINEILMYLKNKEIHDELVREVVEWLAMKHLVISPEKYVYFVKDLEFLEYILTPQRMRIAEGKTKAI